MQPRIRPVPGQPGQFVDVVTNQPFTLTSAYEGERYDTVRRASGAITAGDSHSWFQSLTDKKRLDANFPATGKLVTSSERMVLERIGFEIPLNTGTTVVQIDDVKRAVSSLYLKVTLNQTTIAEGPAIFFPSGYGLNGQTVENASGIASIGVPSTAAAAKLVEPQIITDSHQIEAEGTYTSRSWISGYTLPTLDAALDFRLCMHGLLEKAATNN